MKSLIIPFNEKFSHASKSRSQTETILVCSISENGFTGYGEGCPRSYVTNETIDSTLSFFENIRDKLLKIDSIQAIEEFISNNKIQIDNNPAAFCAIEMAILDLLGQERHLSVEALLGVSEEKTNFQYTAVLGISPQLKTTAEKYQNLGFTDFKIKLSGNLDIDKKNIDLLFNLFKGKCRVRLDANNLWTNANLATDYVNELKRQFFGLEEPLSVHDFKGMSKMLRRNNTNIILDESFKSEDDFHFLQEPGRWIINLRVSKMGGLIRSLGIVNKAKELSIPLIVGAQVGETSLLTRAGLVIARACDQHLVAQEGAFGTHLLEYDIVENPIQFRSKGVVKLDSTMSLKKGLGLTMKLSEKMFR